jgi:hypothetical protein
MYKFLSTINSLRFTLPLTSTAAAFSAHHPSALLLSPAPLACGADFVKKYTSGG